MKIKSLKQRTDNGWTFKIAAGPFWVDNWWYNADSNNIVPPSRIVDGKRWSIVQSHSTQFIKLRNVIKFMVQHGMQSFNTDSFLAPPWLTVDHSNEVSAVAEGIESEDDTPDVLDEPTATEDKWARYFKTNPASPTEA